jgi:hypothetical protein
VANINVTSSGTVSVGDDDKVKIDISGGGVVTIQEDPGETVYDINIELENSDGQSDVVNVDLSSFDTDDLHIDIKQYDASDQINLLGVTWTGLEPGSTDKLTFSYVGSDGLTHTGVVHLKDDGEDDFTAATSPIVICFANGTGIQTDQGEKLIEDIQVGDMICTQNAGLQPVRWIGSRQLDSIFLGQNPQSRPIKIEKDALGHRDPTRDLIVSPQHRLCIGGAMAQLLFGQKNVLLPAKSLINDRTIRRLDTLTNVTYFHMLFDDHQIVFSNGSPSESLHTGDVALTGMGAAARDEVLMLFPELATNPESTQKTAHPVLKTYEARVLQAYLA